jgi:hypothetical protein
MKYAFYISATFVAILWLILVWGFYVSWKIHLLLALAGLIALAGYLVDKKLSNK